MGAFQRSIYCGILSVAMLSQGIVSGPPTDGGSLQVNFLADEDQAGSAVDANSIAVLPFVDLSAAGDQEYFSDGIPKKY